MLSEPAHLPPQCTTLLLDVPLADLAYALVVRLVQSPDIDPRDRLHLNKLQRVMGQMSAPTHVVPISDAILPAKEQL